jgi:hypothetical protein
MREQLKRYIEQDYWVYGLGLEDYSYTVRLAKEFVDAKIKLFRQYAERVRTENPESADDILSDVGYYTYTETEYVWHFCLWRLQAIFEGIIVHKILCNKEAERLIGLKAKLKAIRRAGYSLDNQDYDELLAWAKLRNVLSHAPPEQYRPGPLQESDVLEYMELAKRISQLWLEQARTKRSGG